jgi:hypothetical protein
MDRERDMVRLKYARGYHVCIAVKLLYVVGNIIH